VSCKAPAQKTHCSNHYVATTAETAHHHEPCLITEKQNTELVTPTGYDYISWYSSM